MKKTFFVLLVLLIAITSSYAITPSTEPLGVQLSAFDEGQGPLGPSVISSPGVSGKGSKSLGTGFSYVKIDDIKITQIPCYFTYGLNSSMDITIGIPYVNFKNTGTTEKGLGDIYTGLKYEASDYFTCSIGLILPVGKDEIMGNDNGTDLLIDIPYSMNINFAILSVSVSQLYLNINHDSQDSVFKIGTALSRSINEKLGVSLELTHSTMNSESDLNLYGSIKYKFSNNISTNLIYGKQLDNDSDKVDNIITSSLSINF